MAGFEIFPPWDNAIWAAEGGDLQPLIEALRSREPMPQQVREDLALLLIRVSSIKVKRPAHRPRTNGAAARLLVHWQGAGLFLWAAARDIERIKAAWKDPAAARELAARDPALWATASQNTMRTASKAVELAARYHKLNEQKLINYRRRGLKDRRRS